ncbi:hypothetical protein EDB83DRAFT_2416016, partial [Lactarius deliciosus]
MHNLDSPHALTISPPFLVQNNLNASRQRCISSHRTYIPRQVAPDTDNNRRSAAHRSRNGCGARRQFNPKWKGWTTVWGFMPGMMPMCITYVQLNRRVCASAPRIVWGALSVQLAAAVASVVNVVASENSSHGGALV